MTLLNQINDLQRVDERKIDLCRPSLGKSYIKRSTTADGGEKIVEYSRRSGKHKEIKEQFENSTIFRLQGFDCGGNSAPDTGVYIDENFKVHTRTVAP